MPAALLNDARRAAPPPPAIFRRRSRSEEVGIDQGYLEMLHANHEDWLSSGTSLRELRQRIEPLMSGEAGPPGFAWR